MNLIKFELSKLIKKRYSLFFLVTTLVLFPIIMVVVSRMSVSGGEIPQGLYMETIAYYIIGFSQSYFFMPVWILIFCAQEFSTGHAHRVIFLKSRIFYFYSKITYCLIISFIFSCTGLLSLLICYLKSGFIDLRVDNLFFPEFFIAMFLSSISFSFLLLLLVFIFRSPMSSFVSFIGWGIIEGIATKILKRIYEIDSYWLPIQLTQQFFKQGEEDYRRVFYEFEPSVFVSITFTIILVFLIFLSFYKSDLKPLSD